MIRPPRSSKCAVAIAAAGNVHAALYLGGGEVVADDVIAIGSTIRIDGTIQGDLLALGEEIAIDGRVESDLLVAGQTVIVGGRTSWVLGLTSDNRRL